MPRTILIVDDNAAERAMLSGILQSEYHVVTAASGAEMFSVLRARAKTVSAILLDIVMPDMDGYEVLKRVRAHAVYRQIPVIVTTALTDEESQVKAVALGANGYAIKPYNRELLIHMLQNTIDLREKSALVNTFRKDELTGLPNRKAFLEKAEAMIRSKESGYYVLSCFDIENFKIINDQYGAKKGDEILIMAGRLIREGMSKIDGICCRYMADKFGMLYPAKAINSPVIRALHDQAVSAEYIGSSMKIRIGRYLVNDLSIPVSAMYDRATLAEESIKERYDTYMAEYNDSMRTALLHEQQIVNDMRAALEKGQFEVWFQPQYNHATGALIGAEALVRWHKDGKYISPAEFVPVFERNGFIYAMDQYVWEQVCRFMRRWLDEGRAPLPVSINISRRDLYHTHLIETLTGIVQKYGLSYELIRLEITESAFSEASGQIVAKVNKLIELGFTVEIDDFGSGYSSLNTLKDVPAAILKLDMKFFETTKNTRRGGNIVESIVRMAKYLGMTVIAEGVEEQEQADYLKSIGCYYIQGFYYARPMPAAQYEALMSESRSEPELTRLKTLKTLDNDAFWDPMSMETLIFNSYVGGACICELYEGKAELLRVNDRFMQELGALCAGARTLCELATIRCCDEENEKLLFESIQSAADTQTETTCEVKLVDPERVPGHTEYIRLTVRRIAAADAHYLLYGVIVNMTGQREAERRELESAQQLKVIMGNVNGGVSALMIHDDGSSDMVFCNDKYYELFGYSKQQAIEEKLDVMSLVWKEDMPALMEKVNKLKQDGAPTIIDYRCYTRDGKTVYLRANASLMDMDGAPEKVITSVVTDITEQREISDQLRAVVDNINGGVTATVIRGGKPEFVVVNENYFRILGYTKEQYAAEAPDKYANIHPADRARIVEQFESSDGGRRQYSMEYRIIRRDGAMRYIRNNISVIRIFGIDEPVQLSVANDITEQRLAELKERETTDQLRFLNDCAHDILAQPDCDKAINDTLERLREYFSADRAYVIELDYAHSVSGNTYERCAAGVSHEMENLQNVPFELSEYWFEELRKSQFVVIGDVEKMGGEHEDMKRLLLRQNIRSLIIAPLMRDGVLVGFVGVDNPRKAIDHMSRLMALGDYIAILLTRRDLSAKIVSDQKMMLSLMNDTPGGFVRMKLCDDGKLKPIYANEGFRRMVGMTPEELTALYGDDVLGGVHPDDRDIVRRAAERMLSEGVAESARFRVLNERGAYIWLTLYGRTATDEGGVTYLNVYYADATEQAAEEQRQKALLDNLPCGAALYEYDGKSLSVIHINKRYWQLVGREPVDYAEASIFRVIHPDDAPIVLQEVEAAIRQRRNAEVDVRIQCAPGPEAASDAETPCYKPFRVSATIMPEADGKHLFYATYTPISDETMSVQEMIPVALSTMMSMAEDPSYVKDKDLHYICCSHSFARMLGVENERDLIGKTNADIFSKRITDEVSLNDRRIIETGQSVIDHVAKIATKSGDVRLVSTSKYPIMDAEGNVVGLYGVSRDITDERMTDFELNTLLNAIPSGVLKYAADESEAFAYVNRNFIDGLGYTEEEFKDKFHNRFCDMIYCEDRARVEEEILRQENNGQIGRFDYRIEAADGSLRWYHDEGVKITDQQGKSWYYVTLVDITERKRMEESLRVSEEMNRLAIEHSGNIITRFDVKKRTLTLPASFNPIFVLPAVLHNMPGEQIALGRVSPDTAASYTELFESIVRGNASGMATYQQNSTKGWRWLEAQYTTVFSSAGEPVSAVISFTDITEQLEKEVVYNKWQQSLRERAPESYSLFRCNLSKGASYDSWEGTLLKVDFDEKKRSFNERTREYVEQRVWQEDRERYLAFLNSDTMLAGYYRGRRSDSIEYRERMDDGKLRWLRLSVDLVEYPNSKDIEAYLMYEDIDERKRGELITLERSERDPLTGILNRATFIAQMEEILRSSKPGEQHALFMLDVDEFKSVNDTLGHAAGDEVLRELTHSIGAILRHDDLIGRLGGDEFFVFLKGIPGVAAAETKAKQICALKIRALGAEKPVTASIGIAMIPRDGNDFDTLYKRVDVALYEEKRRGKDGYLFAGE